ncbi:sulfotransferase 2B1 [Xenopus laevis]|uniref:Sulfotransferase n=2 Tax=Xenopus laevis TaxID=8355 RepID=A0A1L8FNR0_XENLA|nr:sulfotransferase 2B1 [Xenopus laevis]OCT73205.1 hypothetical protein XELAEV_18036184mg [Xenopus laevis]
MSDENFEYKGILFSSRALAVKDLEFVENEFQVQDGDIFNVTYPKSGTIWMMELLSLIYTNGDPTWCKTVPSWERVPWIEVPAIRRVIQKNNCPRLFTTHLPRSHFCKSFSGSKAKVIYTARNPKDALVSLYHFAKMSVFFEDPGSFPEFLEKYLSGDLVYGSWFDHIKGWMEMMGNENFLLNTYEALQKDLRGSVIRISSFLGKDLDERALDSVVENASFNNMSKNSIAYVSLLSEEYMEHGKSPFMRKGVSGDWKNHFTVSQSKYFDEIYKEKMKDFSYKFPWDET